MKGMMYLKSLYLTFKAASKQPKPKVVSNVMNKANGSNIKIKSSEKEGPHYNKTIINIIKVMQKSTNVPNTPDMGIINLGK